MQRDRERCEAAPALASTPYEDALHCRLYVCGATEPTVAELLDARAAYLASLRPLLAGYLWQREGFELLVRARPPRSLPAPAPPPPAQLLLPDGCTETEPAVVRPGDWLPHLYLRLRYGDNVEDEWFAVYLVQELTRRFARLVATVCDNDGEVLLIEAAEVIPRWLTPSTSRNRVFLAGGAVHILPLPDSPAALATLCDALELVQRSDTATRAAEPVQRSIAARTTAVFPHAAQRSLHTCTCLLPRSAALTLLLCPALVSAVVACFTERDPLDMRSALQRARAAQEPHVYAPVRMTRCLYAQLAAPKFRAPRCGADAAPPADRRLLRAHEIGTRLAWGFRMLCDEATVRLSTEPGPVAPAIAQEYLVHLEQTGNFSPAAAQYVPRSDLLAIACDLFAGRQVVPTDAPVSPAPSARSPREEAACVALRIMAGIGDRTASVANDVGLVPAEDTASAVRMVSERDSDDSWISVTPAGLDQLLQQRSGLVGRSDGAGGVGTEEAVAAAQLTHAADAITAFLASKSDYEGAETGAPDDLDAGAYVEALRSVLGPPKSGSASSDDGASDESDADGLRDSDTEGCVDAMDRELAASMRDSFARMRATLTDEAGPAPAPAPAGPMEEDVDVNFNMMKHLLDAYAAQHGAAGPASTMLASLGIHLPDNSDP